MKDKVFFHIFSILMKWHILVTYLWKILHKPYNIFWGDIIGTYKHFSTTPKIHMQICVLFTNLVQLTNLRRYHQRSVSQMPMVLYKFFINGSIITLQYLQENKKVNCNFLKYETLKRKICKIVNAHIITYPISFIFEW